MPSRLETADHIVILGYFLLLIGIGLYFWRHMRQASDLFAGGRTVPWWLSGVSFYVTGFSAFTFVAYSEMAYRYGLVAVTLSWSAAAAMLAGTIFLAPRWQRARILSPVEFLEARYSPAIRQVLAWTGIPLRIIDGGLKIYATGIFVSVGLGYDLRWSIAGSGLVMLLYTFMGGLWAVLVTDYVQFIVLSVAVIVLVPLVFSRVEGLESLSAGAPADFLSPIGGPITPLYVLAFYMLVMLSYNGNWAYAQRFYSVRNEREARKAGSLAVALMVIGPPLFILPAVAARTLLPELMVPPNTPQYTYAALAVEFLPAGIMGLMIAAMFSATMSTLSSDYNVVASVVTEDIYRRLFDPGASERRRVLVGRLATLAVGLVTVGIGVLLTATAQRGLFEVMVTVFGLFVGPMLLPTLAGLLSRRLTHRGAAAGILAGFTSGISLYLYKAYVLTARPDVDPTWLRFDYEALTILTNIGVTAGAMVLVTLVERVTPEDRRRIAAFFDGLARPIAAPAPDATAAPPPFALIGHVTLGTGALLMIAAVVQTAGVGRAINVVAGGALVLVALVLYAVHRRVVARLAAAP
ncbi:MAG: sodium/solute symporter [Acidobacteria bacterium]|nr:sodium/solute symporter [Acidobacteriota bacterium]MBA3884216.1 sodium/solute symporter [Acidobacteriota bacterium]